MPGPIVTSDFMLGENYDSRKEISGWDQPGLDVSGWSNATERAGAAASQLTRRWINQCVRRESWPQIREGNRAGPVDL